MTYVITGFSLLRVTVFDKQLACQGQFNHNKINTLSLLQNYQK